MTQQPGQMVRQVLFATDFSASSEAAARVARDYARQFGARLHILHVVWGGTDPVTPPLLARLAEDLRKDVPVVTAAESGAPAAQIVVPSARAAPPHLILRAPLPGAHYRAGVDIAFDAEPSRDPDSSVLLFTWSIDGRPRADHGDRIWVQLPPGEHTLTVVVSDGTSTDDITVSFFVDEPVAPPGALAGPAAAAALFSLASIAGAAFATRVWVARARREAGLPAR